MVINRLREYVDTTVTPLDYLRPVRKTSGVRIGWCSAFPPAKNGAAMVTYTVLKKLAAHKDVLVSAIPLGGRIDKRMLPECSITRIGDARLDAVVFFCLGERLRAYMKGVKAKTIVWQTAHESVSIDPREAELFESVRKSDLVLTMSRKSCEEYRQRGARADYLPAGVDTDIFCPHQSQAPLRVLCATRVHYYKGVSAYLDAIPLVLEKRPDILFRLHGPIDSNTNYAGEILDLIESTRTMHGRNFAYEGNWVAPQQVPQVFKGADIFVFPSDNEGFGVPLIEAMSCGMPCIVLDKFPMNEIVRQSVTGECLPVRQDSMDRYHGYRFPHPEDIAASILRYAERPEELRRAGQFARQRVEQEYSLDGCVRKLLSSVELVTGKRVSGCACSL